MKRIAKEQTEYSRNPKIDLGATESLVKAASVYLRDPAEVEMNCVVDVEKDGDVVDTVQMVAVKAEVAELSVKAKDCIAAFKALTGKQQPAVMREILEHVIIGRVVKSHKAYKDA